MNARSAMGSLTPEKLAAMVVDVVSERFHADAKTVERETRLVEDLSVDDLGIIELELALEERLYQEGYYLDIPDGDETKWVTVGDVIDEVTHLVTAAPPSSTRT